MAPTIRSAQFERSTGAATPSVPGVPAAGFGLASMPASSRCCGGDRGGRAGQRVVARRGSSGTR